MRTLAIVARALSNSLRSEPDSARNVATDLIVTYHSILKRHDVPTMNIDCGGFADMGAPSDLLAQTEPARLAYDHFVKDGYVVLDRVLAPTMLAALDAAFAVRHDPPDDCFKIGGRRYALPVELSGAFADPLLYANPAIAAIVRVALDRSAILKGFGAEVALPDAEPQPIDRNGRPLFDADLSPLLPAHALTCLLPLGRAHRVALWPGSHRWKMQNEEAVPELLEISPGSAAILDSRLLNGATANRSDRPHTVLHAVYSRRWFHDASYGLRLAGARLAVGPEFLAGVAEVDRGLFAHIKKQTLSG